MDYQAIRKEYATHGLERKDLDPDPWVAFQNWLDSATQQAPGSWFESNGMALATADASGRVSVRWVLLKGVTHEGLQFFTNYRSEKARQMDENPHAAVAFHWPYLDRQLRVEGVVAKTSPEVSRKYFYSRPRGSQLGAAISPQSVVIESRAELEEKKGTLDASLGTQPVPFPEHWGGYVLRPLQFEFWQGRLDRMHDRIVYRRSSVESSEWEQVRLAP